jgi:outer membrane protein assembly factor BamB
VDLSSVENYRHDENEDPFLGRLDLTQQETLRRLHVVDDAPAPSESFVRRLRSELPFNSPSDAWVNWQQSRFIDVGPMNGRLNSGRSAVDPQQLTERRPARAYAELIAAGLLVFALIGALVGRDGLSALLSGHILNSTNNRISMYRADPARTGAVTGGSIQSQPEVFWQFEGQDTGTAFASPVVAGNSIIVGAGDFARNTGGIYAIDAQSGVVRWMFRTDHAVAASPVIANEVVYAGCADGNLYAIDLRTGKEKWRSPLGGPVYESGPVVSDGLVYVQSGGAASTPAVADGVVYVGGGARPNAAQLPGEAVLHAIDKHTGKERWQANTNSAGLYAIDAATGQELWRYQTIGPVVRNAPAFADGVVYAVSFNPDDATGVLYAIDVETHTQRWRFTTTAGEPFTTSVAVANGTVYVGNDKRGLYAIDAATGQKRWQSPVNAKILDSAPVVVDSLVLIGGFDGVLHAFATSSGDEIWRIQTNSVIATSPAVVGDEIYLASTGCTGAATMTCVPSQVIALARSSSGRGD